MPKKTNLAEAFRVDANELQPKPEIGTVESTVAPTPPPTEAASKPKKKHIGGYFTLDVYRQMKVLCAEQDMTIQEFLKEGVNAVFRMHDKPPIA